MHKPNPEKQSSIEHHVSESVSACFFRMTELHIIVRSVTTPVSGTVWTYLHGRVLGVVVRIKNMLEARIVEEINRESCRKNP